MAKSPTLVWFRYDLRTADHPALRAAMERGGPVLPVFIWSPDEESPWQPGGASRWWLHQSLKSLSADLEKAGSSLILRTGPSLDVLQELIRETGAEAVYWNRRYEPALIERDKRIKTTLVNRDIDVESFNGSLLFEPWQIKTKAGSPYKVFTPFWKACLEIADIDDPLPKPRKIEAPRAWPDGIPLDDLELEPTIPWDEGLSAAWDPGQSGAANELNRFVDNAIHLYHDGRNRPDHNHTSRLSPHLHFGEISPRMIWHEVKRNMAGSDTRGVVKGSDVFLSEVGWREFAHHLLFHFPHTTEHPLRDEFENFPWTTDDDGMKRWKKGKTGFPIVDAGMRQLWETGWMHNRVRMIVASFLVKDLLIPWQEGAAWFWDTLVDADLASNTLGWQWTAGCGADAAPYFRVFNPMLQGEKFDPDGAYVSRYVPELKKLPAKWIHRPWEAPDDILCDAGVRLGDTYPRPLVDHHQARDRALDAYDVIRAG